MDASVVGVESIYKVCRQVKRKEESLYNALRSIYDDASFVKEIQGLRPELPLLANLRCGLWYCRKFDDVCYFKSTDGHTGNWAFSPTRLNMHLAMLAAGRGGCTIVDATRRGKLFPDSMSKTIPIWTCVLNNAIARLGETEKKADWDTQLHLPSWVSDTEQWAIQSRIDGWVDVLLQTGADLKSLCSCLAKPLRPLWISQKSLIWLNEVPDSSTLSFTPVVLVSASMPTTTPLRKTDEEFSWTYIPGAADDEESWAKGLTPTLFWDHANELIDAGPGECNKRVAMLVEQDKTYKSLHGRIMSAAEPFKVHPIGSTRIAVGSDELDEKLLEAFDAIIDCAGLPHPSKKWDCYFRLDVQDHKFDRFALQRSLPSVVEFAGRQLRKRSTILICCRDVNIGALVSLAILICHFNKNGEFEAGLSTSEISKLAVRQSLVHICSFIPAAQPARGMLRQVYNFCKERRTVTGEDCS